MALINCPECNKAVSDTAKECPNCGYSLKKKWLTKRKIITISTFISLIVIVSISIFIYAEHQRHQQALIEADRFVEETNRPTSYIDMQWLLLNRNPNLEPNLPASSIHSYLTKLNEYEEQGIPFESTEFYVRWNNEFKHYFKSRTTTIE